MCQFDKVAAHQALELVIRTVSRLEIGAERHMVGQHKLRIEQNRMLKSRESSHRVGG
jgi:hypothetical protein